jgi:hypothetical protein
MATARAVGEQGGRGRNVQFQTMERSIVIDEGWVRRPASDAA